MRTTPPIWRVPALLVCGVLAVYFGVAYAYALEDKPPKWVQEHPWALWLGTWQMFTLIDPRTTVILAEMKVDGEWKDLDLDTVLPFHWESGPRYARSSFRSSSSKMKAVGQATCHRLKDWHGISAEAVRFRTERYEKVLGASPQPKKKLRVEPVLEWKCGDVFRLPPGEVW